VDRIPDELKRPLVELLLSVADDKFILGHRNADWTGLAPFLEEDIAFSSLAQDEISHAAALYQVAAGLLGTTPDKLAYGRAPQDYRCAELVELSDEFDWATALGRNFLCDHLDALRLGRLAHSSFASLAQLAGRLAAEEGVHVRHSDTLLRRLGRGGPEAHAKMQAALDRLAPLAATLLEPTEGVEQLEEAGVYPRAEPGLFERWAADLAPAAQEAGLRLDVRPPRADAAGGRRGRHGPAFAALLDELTEVYRLEPEAAW
jgi:ring-1,2-phenylacetyl-CoA epoxidase subunit PaaC